MGWLPWCSILLVLCVSGVFGHGGHEQIFVADNADWMTRHMAEEHHISSFDPGVFFTLHDYDSTGIWSPADIRRTYGLEDDSTASIAESEKQRVVNEVLSLFDIDKSGTIDFHEFTTQTQNGVKLPDFGMGPGHHGDDEYEYEIHHWEKYHSGDDVKEEDLTHPEDIEHFAKHEEMERKQEEWEKRERAGIVESNIPEKFRVN
ncbi:secretory pathway protein-like protein Ssp120 [Lindgomyces ingoldianus]|uniref:Secretory pathway protein-like protein Ssp120 n=1 Tax=Lindgomyces ingoldianus TaxID=673940 RepID=A0ACB6R698_9PLEO|nr:secretory pathway protein-like protein Ssp120 [Lindgomyces ingoldianus]KAF2473840.1 secretory pathway protein-like protein Ssp120 [Lindgomyces ingoldianus]